MVQQPMAAKWTMKDKENWMFAHLTANSEDPLLFQVARVIKNGNKLVFDQDSSGKDMSCIQNKRYKDKIWLRQENGLYVVDLIVAHPQMRSERSTDPHFHRQG